MGEASAGTTHAAEWMRATATSATARKRSTSARRALCSMRRTLGAKTGPSLSRIAVLKQYALVSFDYGTSRLADNVQAGGNNAGWPEPCNRLRQAGWVYHQRLPVGARANNRFGHCIAIRGPLYRCYSTVRPPSVFNRDVHCAPARSARLEPARPLRGFYHWFLRSYTFPSCLPSLGHLAVLAQPVVVEAAPTQPYVSRARLPAASATCCDKPPVGASPSHSGMWRLMAHQASA